MQTSRSFFYHRRLRTEIIEALEKIKKSLAFQKLGWKLKLVYHLKKSTSTKAHGE
ncbi:unnamed protein product [Musa acuminata subsp. burmannicoides]